eukprot:12884164-Prorocentrum_lima.AAC.1
MREIEVEGSLSASLAQPRVTPVVAPGSAAGTPFVVASRAPAPDLSLLSRPRTLSTLPGKTKRDA